MNYGTKYGTSTLNDNIWEKIEKNINNKNLDWGNSTIYQNVDQISKHLNKPSLRDVTDDGGLLNTEIRKSKNCWLEDKYLAQSLFDEVSNFNSGPSQWKLNIIYTQAIQYGIYSEGDYFNWHVDQYPKRGITRKISASIFLNDPDEYEGGELDLEVESPSDSPRYHSFKLPKRSIVLFQSDLWHRVRPITSGVRKTLVVWFIGPPYT